MACQPRRFKTRCGYGIATSNAYAEKRIGVGLREGDRPIDSPCAAPWVRRFCQDPCRTALTIDPLQLTISEKSDRLVVRRPERPSSKRPCRSQGLSGFGFQRSDEDLTVRGKKKFSTIG